MTLEEHLIAALGDKESLSRAVILSIIECYKNHSIDDGIKSCIVRLDITPWHCVYRQSLDPVSLGILLMDIVAYDTGFGTIMNHVLDMEAGKRVHLALKPNFHSILEKYLDHNLVFTEL